MQQTANLGLKKPEGTDVVNIDDLNYNSDKLDQEITYIKNGTTKVTTATNAEKLGNEVPAYYAKQSDLTTLQQEQAAHLADDVKHISYAPATGANSYAISVPGIENLTEGLSLKIKFTNANTGAATLNINGLGAKSIVKSNGTTLSNGNIKAGQITHLVYTGSVFQLLGEGGEYGTATAAEVLNGYTLGTENGIVNGSLSLTGNAVAGDVLIGKTFYNTNAKNKLTGTLTPNTITAGDFKLLTLEEKQMSFTANTWTLVYKIKTHMTGTYRITYEGWPSMGWQKSRIYKNGVAYGIERTTSDYGVLYSEDLFFNKNDTIEIWVQQQLSGGPFAPIKNLFIKTNTLLELL